MKVQRSSELLVKPGAMAGHRPWRGIGLAWLLAIGVLSAQADDQVDKAKKGRSARPNAAAQAKPKSQGNLSPKPAKEQRQVVTGSHIPVKVKRYGRTADTVSPVYILDRKDLERLGAANVGEALRKLPYAH